MSGKYMIVFKKSATDSEIQKYKDDISANGGAVGQVYDTALKGFSATITDSYLQILQQSLVDGPIELIEPDGIVTTQ